MRKIIAWLLRAGLVVALVAVALLVAWAFQSRGMPPLQTWHTEVLESEFTAADATPDSTLQDYLAREARLFTELREKIYRHDSSDSAMVYSRYLAGGPQDPVWPEHNWNRSFELVPPQIRGGALLLHGLTDSPYSLRRIGELLYQQGYYVLGLRLPGHGTIPGALTQVRWEDWVAASRIGARHVRKRIGDEPPFLIAGYSNGGGLAVKYALDALTDASLPAPDRLLLFSPEIGIAPAASIANSHKLLSFLPYFEQFKWLSIAPEYDPFKYNSFPKNAAQEAWEVTAEVDRQVALAAADGRFGDFPAVLTFLSWSDSTVHTAVTVQRLYDRLENSSSELVIFGVNRLAPLSAFVPVVNAGLQQRLRDSSDLPYRLTAITNLAADSTVLAQRTRAAHSGTLHSQILDLAWPPAVFSLSHVAIPFAPDDPVYGNGDAQQGSYRGLALGALQARGETHLLTVPLGSLMRLRHNPFFSYVEGRIVESLQQ